jgi:quinol monooxygenase YgiN
MPKPTTIRRILAASLAILLAGAVLPAADTKKAADPQLAHAVVFALKDHSAKSREAFVAICEKYLTGHKGAVSYTCGTIAEDVNEPGVSDRDFDVALQVVFEDKAALTAYHKSERHDQFVAAIKGLIAKVRVFDSYLPAPK